jgi:hypothetical protein
MKVNRIIFRETGEYNDIALRPYQTDFDRNKVDLLAESTDGGRQLASNNLTGIATGMMRPGSRSEGVAQIASGWGERRLMFMMEVEIRKDSKSMISKVITGYTDHIGATSMGSRGVALDPKMCLYFNNTFNLRNLLSVDNFGTTWKGSISDASQILTRTVQSDLSRSDGAGTLTMRPEDVITRQNVSDEFVEFAGREGFSDFRAGFDRRPLKLSSYKNTQSASFLSKTLTALRDADDDDYLGVNNKEILSAARGAVREQIITSDKVFEELASDTSIMQDGYVTWGELMSMNQDIDDMAEVFMNDRSFVSHRRGDSENWGGSDNETLAATIVANSLPAYMIESMYSKIEFTCTNDTRGGFFETVIGKLQPFVKETNIRENYNHIISRIENDLMREILFNQNMIVFLRVSYSMYGDTVIDIAFDNNPEARFVYPTFCDSVASPIITNNRETLDVLSHDISQIHNYLRSYDDTSTNKRSKKRII